MAKNTIAADKNLFKIPKGFIPHKGQSSYDMPQVLFCERDFYEIECYHRNGAITRQKIVYINWKSTYLPDDIIAWRHIPDDSE